MRVIAGEFRSRRLKSIPGAATRPTPDRLRETLFDILGPSITGATFLDAYAGTGAVGIEALSRGAVHAFFLERNRAALEAIRENLASLDLERRSTVVPGPVLLTLPRHRAGIVFLDPPYEMEREYAAALETLAEAPPDLAIVQHSIRLPMADTYGALSRTRTVRQGDNALSFFGRTSHLTARDFTSFLTARGLAAAGSPETIDDLRRRYGLRRWFEFQDVIDLPPASLFPEQTEPFFVAANSTCRLPPSEFECDFDYHHNGLRTHACALERLTALFGSPEKGVAVNTLSDSWKFGRMSLSIRTFLPEKTTARSPLYEKFPQLWRICRISIARNWIRPVTEAEEALLRSLGTHQILPIDPAFRTAVEDPAPWERGLFRLAADGEHVPGRPPFLWKRDAGIGWCAGAWAAFMERGRGLSLKLDQVAPSRGGGYSRLRLRLANPFSLEREQVATVVLSGAEMHTLDRVAPQVSRFWEIPLVIEESWDD